MKEKITIKRRCGDDPHTLPEIIKAGGTPAMHDCPDVLELDSGDFAVIGIRMTKELKPQLAKFAAGCGPDEEIVIVPRILMANAKRDLPDYHKK